MNYKLIANNQNIFTVVVEDSYDLAMLFCRAQEFYESPNDDFRGKDFSIWDYMKWYTKNNKLGFTYMTDWAGFNIPFETIQQCYRNRIVETPYDSEMLDIITKISKQKAEGKAYVIGTDSEVSDTLKHEMCHALFSLNESYKSKALDCLKIITAEDRLQMEKNLQEMGYTQEVFDDEIQAYLMYGYLHHDFKTKISSNNIEKYHESIKKKLLEYHKI